MEKIIVQYKRYRLQKWLFVLFLLLLLGIVMGFALRTGSYQLDGEDFIDLLQGEGDVLKRQILFNIRLPRILGAVATGMILALSGAVMQILLRNPLASPYTLGISNASAFGAAWGIVVLTNYVENMTYLVPLSAFGGGVIGLAIILILIQLKRATVETIILSGVIVNSLFGAGIAVMQYVADQVELASIVFWNFGDLGRSDWGKLFFLLLTLIPSLFYFYWKRLDYGVLAFGDDYARSMGVDPKRIRVVGLVMSAFVTSVAVSFFGVIAFVGLVVPHLVRMCIGGNEEFLLLSSTLFGGMFLLLCDTLARTALAPIVLPVGIVTSFLGVPLFLFLLIRRK